MQNTGLIFVSEYECMFVQFCGVHSPLLTRGDFVGGRAKLVQSSLTGIVEAALESIMFVFVVVSADNASYISQLNEIDN